MYTYIVKREKLIYPEGKYAQLYRAKIEKEKEKYGEYVVHVEFENGLNINFYRSLIAIHERSRFYSNIGELLSDNQIDPRILETIIFNLDEFKKL